MDIVTPLSSIDNYEELVKVGADEFYCGVVPNEWLTNFNNSMPLNRREYMLSCNISTLSSMEILKRKIDKYKVPVKITLNSHFYNKDQYGILMNYIKTLMKIGFSTFIIADISLIIYLRQSGIDCNIHLSSEVSEINSEVIAFFEQFDISRYIFTRKNSIEDIRQCTKNCKTNAEFEAFILNELCAYTGSFCNTIHCDEMENMCKVPYKIVLQNSDSEKFQKVNRALNLINKVRISDIKISHDDDYKLGNTGCGICKIKELDMAGVTHLKVVGRNKELKYLKEDIRNVKAIINSMKDYEDYSLFAKEIKEKYMSNQCPTSCYYI